MYICIVNMDVAGVQDAALQEHEQRLAGVQQAVAELQRRQDALLQISLDKVLAANSRSPEHHASCACRPCACS